MPWRRGGLVGVAAVVVACGRGGSAAPSDDASSADASAPEASGADGNGPFSDAGDAADGLGPNGPEAGGPDATGEGGPTAVDAGRLDARPASDASCVPLGACDCPDGATCDGCVTTCGGGAVCPDPAGGKCVCGVRLDDSCTKPASQCICPACGDGPGLCVTAAERSSLCSGAFRPAFACP